MKMWTPWCGLFEPRLTRHYLRWAAGARKVNDQARKGSACLMLAMGSPTSPKAYNISANARPTKAALVAKSNRVGVYGASPAAARGRTRPDIVPDRPERDQAQNPEYGCDIGRRHGEAQIVLRFQHKLIKKFC